MNNENIKETDNNCLSLDTIVYKDLSVHKKNM